MEEAPLQCPNGCGETMQPDTTDKPVARADGTYILVRNLSVYRCSECGEITIPGSSVSQVKELLETQKDPDTISELPEYHLKAG